MKKCGKIDKERRVIVKKDAHTRYNNNNVKRDEYLRNLRKKKPRYYILSS